MGRRKEPRKEARLPAKLWGTDGSGRPFIDPVFTRNVSTDGVLIEGIQQSLQPGDSVGLTCGSKKGRFKVAWVGQPDTARAGQVGLESTTKGKCIFDVPVEPSGPDPFVHSGSGERRQFPRLECSAGVEIRAEGIVTPIRGTLADISFGGCYVQMMMPLRVGSKVEVTIWLDAAKITTAGMVTSSHPGFGLGIKFIGMLPADRERLRAYLKAHAAAAAAPKRTGLGAGRVAGAAAGQGPSKFIR
jgi:hypothetical protein